ncbi:MAG: hypothetical protein JW778_04365 [Candidatus Altiarchaeota archaeon]|nr:hypothetical protein [Candidatus Altiarchaeota archaeon]
MTNLILEREWKTIDYELFENKPDSAPFSEDIIKRRELLLIAQCLLSDYRAAKILKDKETIGGLYRATMDLYSDWGHYDAIKKNYSQSEAGKRYFIKMYETAVANNDRKMINFCKSVFDAYNHFGINGHILRPNGKRKRT